jgi:hypothetical protein
MKINLHQLGYEFKPKAQHPTPGLAICVSLLKKRWMK